MAEIERVIEELNKANKALIGTDNDVINGIDIGGVIEEAIQTIRELQNENAELFKKLFLVDCESCKAHYEDAIRELQSQNRALWKSKEESDRFTKFCEERENSKSEEVCEWKKASEDDMSIWTYYPECEGMTDVDISGFHYCPYCGRKIKVV